MSPGEPSPQPARRPPALWQTLRAVAWSFFGVRRRVDYESDVGRLNPVHLLVAGVLGALVFIGTLVLVVRWVVSSGVAA